MSAPPNPPDPRVPVNPVPIAQGNLQDASKTNQKKTATKPKAKK